MICYVDIEHQKVLESPEKRKAHLAGFMEKKLRFEELSGQPCLGQHYRRLSAKAMLDLGIQALILSGNSTDWEEYDFQGFGELFKIIRELDIPVLGLCGGHQLIGLAYGAQVVPMRRLKPGEKDLSRTYHPGMFKEKGFYQVRIVKSDPLFASFWDRITVSESHYQKIKALPEEFELFASTQECRIQAMRHRDKCLYGVQFHPESYDDEHPDGKVLLQNFLRIAGVL